jgi:Spy/CpxP family protein refolding chaperone
MFRLGALAGITIVGLALSVGRGSSQGPGESAGQLPPGWSELGLSEEQRTKIQSIQGECQMRIAELERQLQELQAEQRRKMVAVLTSDQKETLRGKDMNVLVHREMEFRPIGVIEW